MANTPTLQFDLVSASDEQEGADGYAAGMLHLNGTPFWFSNSQDSPAPVEWTWVDFLEHIAAIWPALVAEQTYPFDWLTEAALHPGEMWKHADLRWSRLGDAIADHEEPLLYAFHVRHNLASGWKGIGLPSLHWLRVGSQVWLSPENGTPILANFNECMHSLESACNQIASFFAGSDNVRVSSAVIAWDARQQALASSFVQFSTGLSISSLSSIEQGRSQAEFWDIERFHNWQTAVANDSELLAAARMTKGILGTADMAALIEEIRNVPHVDTPALDKLSREASTYLANSNFTFAHEAGYHLAIWMRDQLGLKLGECFDIESCLSKLNISISASNFQSDHIEAIVCLGQRGPAIILNTARAYAENNQRLRMTLAHELCHLLIDRKNALPVAEVLGGYVDNFVERRAFAFAAELLLPREAVTLARENGHISLIEKLRFLKERFQVSKSVACAQIFNSSDFDLLTLPEKVHVRGKLSPGREVNFLSEQIISKV